MVNYVTQAELDQACEEYDALSGVQIDALRESMAEQRFERKAVFGGSGSLAKCLVEGTGETVTPALYELCYRARVNKLFEERDNEACHSGI